MTKNMFLTGNSSGLGLGFTQFALDHNWQVYGCSRRGCTLDNAQDVICDLTNFDEIPAKLTQLLGNVEKLDLVILNAGILGEIKSMHQTSLDALQRITDINVWANKIILDYLLESGIQIDQIIAISSGAAVMGNKGWNGYAMSKASLNMLIRLYSHEFPNTHLCAIAPGLIDSAMMDYLCVEPDPSEYPALSRIRDARGTEAMPEPGKAAERVMKVLDKLKKLESGCFVDIRQIDAPDEYDALLQARNPGS